MRTIAIILGDNDYSETFRPLLETLSRAIKYNERMTEEAIVASILAGVEFHYVAFQHGSHFGESGYGSIKETVKYLTEGITILFDEKAEVDISQKDHDSGAWYLELTTGNVCTY